MMVANNCCHIHNTVASAMPKTEAKLDVWHLSTRYVAAILNTSKSPFHSAIAADIWGTILKNHAEHGCRAEYWDRGEQEQCLLAAFEKWAKKGVWSAAAQKVHQEQLKHIRKGCLEHSDQDIRSDGSRVEGMHKGWNLLQRAQPSGIVMLSALGHNFILHRNIRVASSRRQMTPFVKFTHGSHHILLSNHVAKLYNGLHKKDTRLLPFLPELPGVDSGETFGLVASDNATTFGGLLIKEETLDTELMHNFEVQTDSFTASNNSVLAAKVTPPSPIKCKAICISPNSDDKVVTQQFPALESTTQSLPINGGDPAVSTGQTRSQCLFSIATGINPRSLTIQHSDEFYLFMNMWA
ncbi:hypothetical protein EV702DRAFT_1180542 [Suillus placidus]|uniref:Uncharacterized protein n=1 Tax=Suillus placidus TaxID=48579 RepID=A0A9P6ZRJ0_9AGAM|nr:hypothetical protein EV702DRAFT_1180542 [Suillus placidus]